MELAALASAAIPGLSPTSVTVSPDSPRDFDAAVVMDDDHNRWRVRSPKHEKAAFRLETELQVLSGFTPGIRAKLPFRAPSVAGAVQQDELRTFVYHNMPGIEVGLDAMTAPSGHIPQDIGRIISSIHQLTPSVVDAANLPRYTADEFRSRRLNELDQAALTGAIPSILLRRWENALEEKSLWDFTPQVVHGDLHEDNLLVERDRVVAVIGWTDLHIGDPATDFSWLASVQDPSFVGKVLEAYRSNAGTEENLMRRASLAAEFALAQWLVQGIAAHDEDIQSEAADLLNELAEDVRLTGGQDIGISVSQTETSVDNSADQAGPDTADAPESQTEAAPETETDAKSSEDDDPSDDADDAVIVERDEPDPDEPQPDESGHQEPAEPFEPETAPSDLDQLNELHQRHQPRDDDSPQQP